MAKKVDPRTRVVLRPAKPGVPYELFRVLVADDVPLIEIAALPGPDPGTLGLILGDVTKHYAELYAKTFDCTVEEAQNRIIEAYTADIASPTATVTGEFRTMERDDERQKEG